MRIRCDSVKLSSCLLPKTHPKEQWQTANTHTNPLLSVGAAFWLLGCFACALHAYPARASDLPEEKSEKRSAPGNDLLSFFMGENVVNLFLLLRNACMMNILSRTTTAAAAEEEKKRKGARRSLFSLFSPLFERTGRKGK
jgi:hypothetical protein